MITYYTIEKKKESNNSSYDMHMHKEYEILFVLNDGVRFFSEDTTYISQKGDIFIFQPFHFHKTNIDKMNYMRYLFCFNSFIVSDFYAVFNPLLNILRNSQIKRIHLNQEEISTFIDLLETANEVQDKYDIYSEFNKLSAFGNLLTFLIKRIDLNETLNPSGPSNTSTLEKIVTYITQNVNEDLSTQSICKKFHISKTSLWNMLKKEFNMPFNDYVINIRISRAMELLLQKLSITEVMSKCGFNSYPHFLRTFKKITGTSPYKYSKTFNTSIDLQPNNLIAQSTSHERNKKHISNHKLSYSKENNPTSLSNIAPENLNKLSKNDSN